MQSTCQPIRVFLDALFTLFHRYFIGLIYLLSVDKY